MTGGIGSQSPLTQGSQLGTGNIKGPDEVSGQLGTRGVKSQDAEPTLGLKGGTQGKLNAKALNDRECEKPSEEQQAELPFTRSRVETYSIFGNLIRKTKGESWQKFTQADVDSVGLPALQDKMRQFNSNLKKLDELKLDHEEDKETVRQFKSENKELFKLLNNKKHFTKGKKPVTLNIPGVGERTISGSTTTLRQAAADDIIRACHESPAYANYEVLKEEPALKSRNLLKADIKELSTGLSKSFEKESQVGLSKEKAILKKLKNSNKSDYNKAVVDLQEAHWKKATSSFNRKVKASALKRARKSDITTIESNIAEAKLKAKVAKHDEKEFLLAAKNIKYKGAREAVINLARDAYGGQKNFKNHVAALKDEKAAHAQLKEDADVEIKNASKEYSAIKKENTKELKAKKKYLKKERKKFNNGVDTKMEKSENETEKQDKKNNKKLGK